MEPIEFNKDIGEMNEAEARATLREFQSKYESAKDDYEDLEGEVESYKEDLEDAREDAEEAREFFAEFAAEESGLGKETILDKFGSAEEIREEFLEDAEFSLVTDEEEETEEEESKFEDNPEKSDNLPGDGDSTEYQEKAEKAIEQFTIQHNDY